MANVGDYMRVKSVYSNGEVKTMEALPNDDMLKTFSSEYRDAYDPDLALLLTVSMQGYGLWSGSYIVTNPGWGEHSIVSLRIRNEPTIFEVSVSETASSFSGNQLLYYSYDSANATMSLYSKAKTRTKILGGVLSTHGSANITAFNEAPFNISQDGSHIRVDNPYYSEGGDLVIPGTIRAESNSWIAPALQNGWVNYGGSWETAGYRKMPDGRIEIKGLVRSGAFNSFIFTLPVGYRPSVNRIFTAVQGDSTVVRINVASSGGVYTTNASNNSFQSIELSFYP